MAFSGDLCLPSGRQASKLTQSAIVWAIYTRVYALEIKCKLIPSRSHLRFN